MRRPLLVNDLPLLFDELDTKPGHDAHPCVAERGDKFLADNIPRDLAMSHGWERQPLSDGPDMIG